MMDAKKLDKYYAVKMNYGDSMTIFPYFEVEDGLQQNIFAGSVVLSVDGIDKLRQFLNDLEGDDEL